eukprot:GHVS01032333.1.p1 GENE.GHVS01032333.1~~GHVS01032333.1.p1  ORF type:complete len:216 (+),score=79.70 GHVS01032333.1:291-938(+)
MSSSFCSLSSSAYEILAVCPSSSTKAIKSAYRKQARLCHPDKQRADPTAEDRFNKLKDAYDLLLNVDKRKELDETLLREQKRKEKHEKQSVEKRKFKEELEAREKAADRQKVTAASSSSQGRGAYGGWMHQDPLRRKKRKEEEDVRVSRKRKESVPSEPPPDVRVGVERNKKQTTTTTSHAEDSHPHRRPPGSMTAAEFEAQTLQQLLMAAERQS